jgi:hypothetical protein
MVVYGLPATPVLQAEDSSIMTPNLLVLQRQPARAYLCQTLQMHRPVDPRAITFQEVNHTPLVLPSAAAEALRGVQL